ncbi:hypothetical protein [Streptomyces daghestanicus]|uniref:hypothetical protein n=1 Tax=Streptomyces daghestanicus TaxID=66885 RepID=UPI003570E395
MQKALLAASRQAGGISAGSDRSMPGAAGSALASGPADRVAGRYLRRVLERYPGDPVVRTAFRSVLGLCAPVTSLFAPSVAVLRPPMPTPAEPPTSPEEPGA